MTIVRILSSIAMACWLAATANAQSDACDANAGPPSADFEHYAAQQWPLEAERAKGNRQNVSRVANRLRLALEKGDTVELASPNVDQLRKRPLRRHGLRQSGSADADEQHQIRQTKQPPHRP